MELMTVKSIKGVRKIDTFTFSDERGTIREIFKNFPIVSVTHTHSFENVLRGIHVQDWDKVIYLATGGVHAVFYDDRKDSQTYGKHMEVTMFPGDAYFIPRGVGNSYFVIDKTADYFYFNTEEYDEDRTYTISYKKVNWPITNPVVSKKDENAK